MATHRQDTYDEHSIIQLDDRAHVRLRPAMYMGDTGVFGLHHLVYEVVDNSIDELTNGFGDTIICTIHKNGFVTVDDNGRGIPVGIQSTTGKSAVESVMTSLRAGGKFNNTSYKSSSGLHGIGVSAVNFLSEKLNLIIYRDGYKWQQSYTQGIPDSNIEKCEESSITGTIVSFKPDHKIFQTVEFQRKILYDRLKELAYLNKGIKIVFKDEREDVDPVVFHSDGGISAFITDLNSGKESICPVIYLEENVKVKNEADEKNKQYEVHVEVAFQYTKTYSDIIYSFANNVNTRDGGSHLSGFKSALLESIIKYADRKKLLKGLDIKPTPRDVLEGLTAVISIKLPNPEFEGQTKATLGNPEIKIIINEQVVNKIDAYFSKNDEIAFAIVEKITQACIAREEARKARDTVRRKNILSSSSLPGKLADCSEKNPELCEVIIVEGDCFAGDTLIHTINGLRRLDSIKTGDLIYTHMHRYRPALERKPKIKRRKCRITIQGITFVCSQDHLWGVMRANDNECEWVPAKDLKITDLIVKTVLPGDEYCKVVNI